MHCQSPFSLKFIIGKHQHCSDAPVNAAWSELKQYQLLTVVIDDSPGSLASLLTFIGEVGVNIEDLKLEHSPGAQIGLVEIQVLPEAAERLSEQLTQNGWRLV